MTRAPDETDAARAARWGRLKELFAAALEFPRSRRDGFVTEACGDDPELRTELEGLLRAAEIDDGFLEQPVADALGWTGEQAERDWIGRRIGPYRILELAGRGGLSRVYRAVREGAEYERSVAIKLLRAGVGGEALLRRFRAERRMLAALTHPNIAHFLDGGATEDGTPYLVMEFVDGRPLDEYCDAQALPLEVRIELFRVLCSAVHHVHQHLMVHGDLKGGNVLVTPQGVVKLLDFGIAKLLTPDATTAEATRPATVMMLTPQYASPEQVRGEPVTTASDVYSLGALLYRLLTGATPYGQDQASAAVIAQRMAADDPTPPHEAAAGAHAAFAAALRGDLGSIVLKALKSEPSERYSSAQQMADDLQRWARGFPVEARPDSAAYRLRKWAARHRTVAVLSAFTALALAGGIAATSWQAHLARQERARAERHFEAVRELSAVFLEDVYQAIVKIPGSTEARKLLVDNTLKYLQALERDAQDSVELRRDLGIAYERLADVQGAHVDPSLGEYAAALASYRRSLEIRRQLAHDHPSLRHRSELLRAEVVLVEALLGYGDVEGARKLGPEMLALAGQIDSDPAADRIMRRAVGAALMTQGWLEWSSGHAEAGLNSLNRARDVYRRIAREVPDDSIAQRDLALVLGRLGEAQGKGQGDCDAALRSYREAATAFDHVLRLDPGNGELARMLIYTRANVAELYNCLQRPREGLAEIEAILPQFRQLRDADPADQVAPVALAAALNIVGESRLQLGDFAVARATFEEAAPLVSAQIAAQSPDIQLIAGGTQSGLARSLKALAASGTASDRIALGRQAEAAGHRALDYLVPIAGTAGVKLDATRQIEAVRGTFGWSG